MHHYEPKSKVFEWRTGILKIRYYQQLRHKFKRKKQTKTMEAGDVINIRLQYATAC